MALAVLDERSAARKAWRLARTWAAVLACVAAAPVATSLEEAGACLFNLVRCLCAVLARRRTSERRLESFAAIDDGQLRLDLAARQQIVKNDR